MVQEGNQSQRRGIAPTGEATKRKGVAPWVLVKRREGYATQWMAKALPDSAKMGKGGAWP
jgi:hypothetical protein